MILDDPQPRIWSLLTLDLDQWRIIVALKNEINFIRTIVHNECTGLFNGDHFVVQYRMEMIVLNKFGILYLFVAFVLKFIY